MPNVIIGHKKWMRENRETVKGMLGAIFDAGDRIKKDDGELRRAAAISAVVYGEKDARYWYRYFSIQKQKDKQGLTVELGGSSVNNLADNRELFGLAHVVVAHRPGWKVPTQGPLGELMVDRGTGAVNELHNSPAGRIYVHAVTQLEISSTELRQIIDAGRDPRFLVPDTVREIIRDSGCYARPR
jgi:nicotinic acid mononucleotide adenylyltransferase